MRVGNIIIWVPEKPQQVELGCTGGVGNFGGLASVEKPAN